MRWWIVLLIACGSANRDSGPDVSDASNADVPDVPPDAGPAAVGCDDSTLAAVPDRERDVDIELRGPRPILLGGAWVGDSYPPRWGASCWRVMDASPDSGIDVGDVHESDTSGVSVALVHPESWVLLEGRARDIDGQLWSTQARIRREAQPGDVVALVRNEPVVGYGSDDGLLATSHHIGRRHNANTVLQVLTDDTWVEQQDDGEVVLHHRGTVSVIDGDPAHLFLSSVPFVSDAVLINGITLTWLEGGPNTLQAEDPIEQAAGHVIVAGGRLYTVTRDALVEIEAPVDPILMAPQRFVWPFIFSDRTIYWVRDELRATPVETLSAAQFATVGDLVAASNSFELWGATGFALSSSVWKPAFGKTTVSYQEAYGLPEDVTLRAAHISYRAEWFAFGNDETTWEAFMWSMNPDD